MNLSEEYDKPEWELRILIEYAMAMRETILEYRCSVVVKSVEERVQTVEALNDRFVRKLFNAWLADMEEVK